MEPKRVLVLGALGMLGQELVRVHRADDSSIVVAWDIREIDVTDRPNASEAIRRLRPNIIYNAVAYNAVDACEESEAEFDKAMQLNAEVPQFLAHLAKTIGSTLVHYSTDYVFDGENEHGYAEDAEPRPISNYGASKREGEVRVLAEGGQAYVIRLSKLFGKPAQSSLGKKSFFEKMLEAARTKSEVTVVDDEKSCFTFAPDLARASASLVEDRLPSGIYHLTNAGAATWYEAARELFRLSGQDIRVVPVPASAFPRPARRPRCSELRNTKVPPLRPYTIALRDFVAGMVQ